jgi:hypothetical protein
MACFATLTYTSTAAVKQLFAMLVSPPVWPHNDFLHAEPGYLTEKALSSVGRRQIARRV